MNRFECTSLVLVQNFKTSGVAQKMRSHNLAGFAREFFELGLAQLAGRFGSPVKPVSAPQ